MRWEGLSRQEKDKKKTNKPKACEQMQYPGHSRGVEVERVQTDNGVEFTKRFLKTKDKYDLSLFETVFCDDGLIRPILPEKWKDRAKR